MRQRLAALLAALLAGTALAVLAPSSPASATTPTVCAGIGGANVFPGLFYPVGTPQITTFGGQTTVLFHNTHRVASWTFSTNTGVCTNGGSVTAVGSLQGYCGHSVGVGTTTTGHLVQWVSLGGLLLLTNGVVGTAVAQPAISQGESCFQTSLGSPGALVFDVVFAITFTNCPPGWDLLTLTPVSKGLTSDFFPLTFSVLDPTPNNQWHVTFPVPHIHWSIHGCLMPTFLK